MIVLKLEFIPEIFVGSMCNNNCTFCSYGNCDSIKYRKTDEIKKELDSIRSVNENKIRFTGGETTIRKDIFDLVKYAKELGFEKIEIETNGRMFFYREFTKKIIEAGANYFSFSIHGHNSELHDSITRASGSFNQAVQGIKNIKELCEHPVRINVVIIKANYKFLPDIVKYFSDLVSEIKLSFVTIVGNVLENKEIVPKMSDVVPFVKDAVDMSKNNVKICTIPFCLINGYEDYNIFFKTYEKNPVKMENGDFIIKIEPKLFKDFVKNDGCKICKFDQKCFGQSKKYVEMFGFEEINPIRKN